MESRDGRIQTRDLLNPIRSTMGGSSQVLLSFSRIHVGALIPDFHAHYRMFPELVPGITPGTISGTGLSAQRQLQTLVRRLRIRHTVPDPNLIVRLFYAS